MKTWMKAAVSLLLMAILIWQVDAGVLLDVFASTRLDLLLAAFALFLFQQVVVAYCWHMLLVAENQKAPFFKTVEVHFIGSFFGTFLPSSIGMDVIRAYRLGRFLKRGVDAASSMFVARVTGFLVNFILALAAAVYVARSAGDHRVFGLVLLLTAAFVAAVMVSLHNRSITLLGGILGRLKWESAAAKIVGFRNTIIRLAGVRRLLINLIGISFFYQIAGIVIVFLLGRALAIELDIWHYFVYIPLITAIMLVPFSLAGIGIREGAFVFFFAQAGVLQAQSLSLSLLLFAQTLCLALLGGVWYFLSRDQASEVKDGLLAASSHDRPVDAVG